MRTTLLFLMMALNLSFAGVALGKTSASEATVKPSTNKSVSREIARHRRRHRRHRHHRRHRRHHRWSW
jgi:hypothetical protein